MHAALCSALLRIAQAWLDPHYPLRRRAVKEAAPEFCLSPPNFELALHWIFSQWTESTLAAHCAQPPFPEHRSVVQVLAGTTPAMIAQGFLQGAFLNRSQCLKIPSQQTVFARLLRQSFGAFAPTVAALFEVHDGQKNLPRFYSQLAAADLVLIYGQDKTIATLKKYIAPHTLLLAHGHADSVAVIFKEAATLASLQQLAYDFLSYDQRGCLSPRITLVEQGGELSPEACAALFAKTVLPPLAEHLPRGGLFAGEAEAIYHQRNLYGFRGQVYTGADWTVCFDGQPAGPLPTLPRFLPFQGFTDTAALRARLNPLRARLISVGYAGPEARREQLALGPATRFSKLGEMQRQLLIF